MDMLRSLTYRKTDTLGTSISGIGGIARIFLLFLLSFMLLVSCGARNSIRAAGTGSLSKKKLSLYQGQAKKLKVRGTSGSVTWTSTDPTIASVSAKGKVYALKPGICRVTADTGSGVFSCRVKVKPVAFTEPALTMVRGRQTKLNFNYSGVKDAVWSSSNPKVVRVLDGTVTSLLPGSAVVTARWKGLVLKCTVTVTNISDTLLMQAYPVSKENRGKIVLAGSSSMDFWVNAPQAFAPYEVINTAIAGTTTIQWLNWYRQLITGYKPSAVVIYVGSNDLGNGGFITGEQNAANTIKLLKKIRKKLKNVPLFYVSVSPCWSRKGAWQDIRVSNSLVKKFIKKQKNMYFIDVASACAKADGTPEPGLFLADQLHPSERGYMVWEKKVAKKVRKVLKKSGKKS